jgi:hypothetical protein
VEVEAEVEVEVKVGLVVQRLKERSQWRESEEERWWSL